MKNLLTVAILLVAASFVNAQNVYVPYGDFKQQLLNNPAINTNQDQEIQLTEALAVINLNVSCTYNGPGNPTTAPTDLTGIRSFANLQRLTIESCDYNGAADIDLSGLANLRYFNCNDPLLSTLELTGCTGLDSLVMFVSKSSSEYNYSMHRLDLTDCINLKHLDVFGPLSLDTVLMQNCTNLKTLRLFYFGSGILDLTGLVNLEEIDYEYGGKMNLDLRGFTKLRKLYLLLVAVSTANLHDCISLEELSYAEDFLANGPKYLDLSNSSKLRSLYLYGLPDLKNISIKNGSSLNYQESHFPETLVSICADDFEVDSLRYMLNNTPNINIYSYCSFFPGGAYNTIKGKVRLDELNNGCLSGNRNMAGVAIKFTDAVTAQKIIEYSGAAGEYATYTNKGNFALFPYFPYPYFTVSPASSTVIFDTVNSLTTARDFCIVPNGVHNDLEIIFLPTIRSGRPGFDAGYTMIYKNRGTTTLSGNVHLNFDNSKMNFVAASENLSSQSSGQLSWNYNNLQPFESKTINVTFNLLPPPVNNIGDTIIYLAAITPSVNDETAFDNSFILPQLLRGSFDPNEKQCLEGSKIDISQIGDYLHYQVHFQNEGTDTAFNIVVADTLSNKLDWGSFEFTGSSHPCNAKLTNNKAEFFFQNINLPYKAINEPASNGYVAFKIKPKPSLVVGDSLNNTAAIYFDFNLPVITNRATTVVTNASTPVPVKVEYFSISSRNNINTLNWKAACSNGLAKFSIERSDDGIHFSSIGSITATAVRCQLPFNFTDNNPVAGKNYYRLKITDADGISFYSKTLVTGNNRTGVQITGIANNIVYFTSNKQQSIQMKVVAADGKVLYEQSKTIAAGNNNINLQIKNGAKEIFTLIVYTNEGEIITRKFIQ